MEAISISAKGKINLTLDVTGKYPDGYHQVEMIMQSVDIADRITIKKHGSKIELTTNHPQVPVDETNLCFKAIKLVQEKYGIKAGVHVHIEKNIPVAGGMAGGSTNGAAVLVGLNQLWELGLTETQLRDLGFSLGADVPFCIQGGTAIATGKGEKLTSIQRSNQLWFVLVKPPFGVSTAQVYGNLDLANLGSRPNTEQMVSALAEGNLQAVAANMRNVLETVTLKFYPEVAKTKTLIEEAGALKALMSGSGPTVMGLAADEGHALTIADHLQGKVTGQVMVTRAVSASQVAV